MKTKFMCLILVIVMVTLMVLPTQAAAVDNLATVAPSTPSGFRYVTSVNRNKNFDASINDVVLTIVGLIPGAGWVSAAISLTQNVASQFKDNSIPVKYIDHIYEANNPEMDYGVPYVYWHKLEYKISVPGGATYTRWSSYYEYAVAPR